MTDVEQYTREALKGMTAEQLLDARRQGHLAALLGGAIPQVREPGQLEIEDARRMTRPEIHDALRKGQFATLLGMKTNGESNA